MTAWRSCTSPQAQRTTTTGGGLEGRTSVTAGWRPKAQAHALQQLDLDRAILIEGRMLPAVIRLVPWWEDRELRKRAMSADPSRS